jgi:hypothetical protein
MDEFTQVARMYLDCIDKEGFVFDFDLAWRAAGYSRKDAAKRVLLRAPFVEGQHYTITTTTGRMGQTNEAGQTVEVALQGQATLQGENTGVHFPPIGEEVLQGRETRMGRPVELIKLTAIGMGQFCLSAQTERGRMLRDFVMQLTLGFKRFAAAVQAGEIEVRRVSTEQEARGSKRLKVCESQKHLMQAAHGHEGLNAGVYARINGVTNKVVTGRYKHELARELGKPAERSSAPSSSSRRSALGGCAAAPTRTPSSCTLMPRNTLRTRSRSCTPAPFPSSARCARCATRRPSRTVRPRPFRWRWLSMHRRSPTLRDSSR